MGSTATTKTTRSHHQLAALLTSRVPPELRPAALTAIRVYALGWSVTTVPGTLAIVIKALITATKKPSSLQRVVKKAFLRDLPRQLRSSVLQNGLPYLLAGAFAGHHFLAYAMQHHLLKTRKDKAEKIAATTDEDSNGGDSKKKTKIDARVVMFLSSAVTMIAVRRAFPRSKTLDFTFFALVRALDVIAHRVYSSPVARRYLPNWSLEYGSVIVFTLACMEIMFAWFFAPERLPRSYSMWITKMSEMDERLLFALRAIREGKWIYGKDTGIQDLLGGLCEDLGLPKEMGDPVNGRIPCLVVHQGQPYGCEVHSMTRFIRGFIKVFPLYFAVHFTPRLLFRTSSLVKNPTTQLLHTLKATMRSSAFLASFIAIIWYAICLTRTRIGHQLLGVDQSRLDNTLAPFIGCALCGLSLLIESKHRRGEMALYVVPRALYSLTERVLGPYQRGRWWEPLAAETAETLVFASSITVVLDAMFKDQSTVRSSVRGLLSWILKDELKPTKQEQNGKTA